MASEDKVRVLREKDVIFDRSVKHYINECKRTHQDFQINQVLGVSWVGSPSAIKLASSFKGFVRPNGPEDTLRRSFRALLLKRFEKASTDVCFNPADPPAWLRNALENSFFCTLLSDLYKSHPSNKVFEFGERHWRRKQQQENSRLVVTKTLVERFAVPFVELVRSNEEVIEAKLASFAVSGFWVI
ncbi:hypothetical protein L0F63_000696 [Massospora cicadina]|nr:hypothetical protein L0F63_000696 [Massospora cicadina]